jgi:hypothetical protein
MTRKIFLLLTFLLLLATACTAPTAEEAVSGEEAVVIDVYLAPT